jgi:hypothetical protein
LDVLMIYLLLLVFNTVVLMFWWLFVALTFHRCCFDVFMICLLLFWCFDDCLLLLLVQLPSAALWMTVCRAMHDFLFDATLEGRALGALNTMKSLLDPDLRFSERSVSNIMKQWWLRYLNWFIAKWKNRNVFYSMS